MFLTALLFFLLLSGGDGHCGIGEELLSRAEKVRTLPSALRVAQEAVRRRRPRHGGHLLPAAAGERGRGQAEETPAAAPQTR